MRELPNDIKAEKGVLGSILLDPTETFPKITLSKDCLLYTSPSPRDYAASRMPSSA